MVMMSRAVRMEIIREKYNRGSKVKAAAADEDFAGNVVG